MSYYTIAKGQWRVERVSHYQVDEENAFISKYVDVTSDNTLVVKTTDVLAFDISPPAINAIVNLGKVNDIRYINKFFEKVNARLKNGDIFIGCFETITARRERLFFKKVPVLGTCYLGLEFVFARVCPKVTGLQKVYFAITKGKGRLLSKAEALGRIVCCGFEILELQSIKGLTYFAVKKVKEPAYDMHPSYGPLFKMQRVGKDGKMIGVYKFRTMHPYSEYLQDYILKQNGYSAIGKPANDFRLTSWGRFMRRYWLDELPQLINVLKGEMSLVGVRPLSKRFLAEYPDDIKQRRQKYKPGCVPPYVALLKQDVKQYIESENIYLTEKEKSPFTTDVKYLFKALVNILTNKIKSA